MKKQGTLVVIGLALISAAVTAPLSAEVVRKEDGPPGYFSVGNWTGRCVRDGWLGGAAHESCGARLEAFVSINMSRTVKGLTVTLEKRGCKLPVTAKIGRKALVSKDRAEKLEKQIARMAVRLQKRCGPDGEMYPATKEDLADILTETDGLEF